MVLASAVSGGPGDAPCDFIVCSFGGPAEVLCEVTVCGFGKSGGGCVTLPFAALGGRISVVDPVEGSLHTTC